MNSKQIIKDVIEFNSPKRIGMDFNKPHQDDIACISVTKLINPLYEHQKEWGYYEEALREIPDFQGEVRRDPYGNIYGRLEEKTKGECIKGALQEGWEYLDTYELPKYNEAYEEEVKSIISKNEDKYLLGTLSVAVFSTIRDLRKIDNLLMDVILEKDNVIKVLKKIEKLLLELIDKAGVLGFDGVIVYDDWGTQTALLINPVLWRELFKPIYARIVKEAHDKGLHFFVHSCGYVYDIIEDFIEIGVDVLQFDQPELVGINKLSDKFGGRVTFWSPVDIQKVMATGDKEYIQRSAEKMMTEFGSYGGGFIAKDYPTWEDIDVKEEWAQWARDVFLGKSKLDDID
ncbi:uroporphyrinogen decarboxylase family protein [Vallitalea guaymasensis]|uniref:uroporphyrinogen decarboxylase family protein n=1 Tax=Vallitalea guaymasensis TaxID=1185412 RepID=UPI002729BF80|nr:uroporphyrinogen decarboxylase family protein [Vallitalea guaymasensis]